MTNTMWPFRRKPEDRTLDRQSVPAAFFDNGSSASGAVVTPENAMGIADAFACVRALADAAASLPLKVYRRTGEGREELRNRTDDLLTRPAPGTTQANLIGQIVAHLNLFGNAYCAKLRSSGGGQVEQLWCLPPAQVVPELRAGLPVYTYTDAQGKRSVLTEVDLIHVKALSTDGLLGLSPVRQAKEALGLNTQLRQHSARFFQSDARPSGILSVPPGAESQNSIENLKSAWEQRHAGADKAHRIAVVSGDVGWTSVGMSADDAQFLQQRQLSAQEVARIFRIPPWVIGAPTGDSLTYATVEQQGLHFVTYSLRPWLVLIEQAFTADRDLFGRNEYCEFLLDALLRADAKTRAEVYALGLDPERGWLDRDSVRRMESLPPDGREAPAPTPEETTNA